MAIETNLVTPSGLKPLGASPVNPPAENLRALSGSMTEQSTDFFAGWRILLHPSLRPITLGVLLFVVFNLLFTLGVTLSPLNAKFNFSYGNFLPVKLSMLKQSQPNKLDVLFMGTSQTNNGFITSEFERVATQRIALLNSGRNTPGIGASGQHLEYFGSERPSNVIPSATNTHEDQSPLNSFNLGLPNNRYDIMQAYLQMHVRQYGKPRLLLVELSPSIQERNAYLYYLPALYYRTLLEKDPTLAPSYLGNPLLAWNVKEELLLSAFSSLHQYRYTFSPVNMLGKVSGKISEKLQTLSQRFQSSATQNKTSQAAFTTDKSSPARRDPFQPVLLGMGSAQAHADGNQSPALDIQPDMTAKGWYPKEQSPHMTTPAGVQLSVAEARKYYIDAQREVNFEKLSALLAYCEAQKIPVVLVSWPNHPAFLKVFNQSSLATRYQQGMQHLLAQHAVPVINMNQNLPSWQSETEGGVFADPRHLTPEGAQFFSGQLAGAVFSQPDIARLFVNSNRMATAKH